MALVTHLTSYHKTSQGELKLWFEYDDVTLAVTSLIYDNTFSRDANFHFEFENDPPVDLVFTKNTVQAVIPVTPNKYILTIDPVTGKILIPSTIKAILSRS